MKKINNMEEFMHYVNKVTTQVNKLTKRVEKLEVKLCDCSCHDGRMWPAFCDHCKFLDSQTKQDEGEK